MYSVEKRDTEGARGRGEAAACVRPGKRGGGVRAPWKAGRWRT